MTDERAEQPMSEAELAGIEQRDAAASLDECESCHEYAGPDSMADRRVLLTALRSEREARGRVEAALGIAWDIIEANPGEDACRHARFVDECPGEDDEPCIDRSRRETIRAALFPSTTTPEASE